jgi:hypothetical protein
MVCLCIYAYAEKVDGETTRLQGIIFEYCSRLKRVGGKIPVISESKNPLSNPLLERFLLSEITGILPLTLFTLLQYTEHETHSLQTGGSTEGGGGESRGRSRRQRGRAAKGRRAATSGGNESQK